MEDITSKEQEEQEAFEDDLAVIDRDVTGTLYDVWQRHFNDLSELEKQWILRASDLGMPDSELKKMFNMHEQDLKLFCSIF